MMAFGEYPPQYNPKVHGPYDPARYYGKPDTPFHELKLNEVGSWISRRSFSPVAMAQACSRFYWRWNHRYILPIKSNAAGHLQLIFGLCVFSYIINYGRISAHRTKRYH